MGGLTGLGRARVEAQRRCHVLIAPYVFQDVGLCFLI